MQEIRFNVMFMVSDLFWPDIADGLSGFRWVCFLTGGRLGDALDV